MALPKLPHLTKFGRIRKVVIDTFKEKDFGECEELFSKLRTVGDGVDRGFNFRDYQLLTTCSLTIRNADRNKSLVGYVAITDSFCCRSNKPLMHGAYTCLDPAYRSEGMSVDMVDLVFRSGMEKGYTGKVGRLLNGAVLEKIKAMGIYVPGYLPNCWHDGHKSQDASLTLYLYNYPKSIMKSIKGFGIPDVSSAQELPTLQERMSEKAQSPLLMQELSKRQHGWTSGNISLQIPTPQESLQVETMIRNAANKGEGFALDEFNSHGFLSRRMFHHSVTLVARRRSDNMLVGGAILGPTALSFTTEFHSLGVYLVIDPLYRRCGYGSEVLSVCEEIGRSCRFSQILTDAFIHNPAVLCLATAHSLTPVGTVPHCGWLKGAGYTPLMFLHKDI